MEQYLSELTLSESTIRQYKKTIALFITWLSKRNDYSVREPTRAAFCIYYQELKKKGRSVRTIDNYTACIREFFQWLLASQYYDKDITQGTRSLRKSNDYIRAPLTDDQAMKLLQSLKGDKVIDKRNFAIVNLMLFVGLRRIEVTRLDVRDIYQSGNQWYIKIHGKGHNEKDAELPITNRILAPIQEYWTARGATPEPDEPAFLNHSHSSAGRITPHFVSDMVKTSLRSMGLMIKLTLLTA